MEGFILIALYEVDKGMIQGGYWIVVSEFGYYRNRELFEHWEAAMVIAHGMWSSRINDLLQSGDATGCSRS